MENVDQLESLFHPRITRDTEEERFWKIAVVEAWQRCYLMRLICGCGYLDDAGGTSSTTGEVAPKFPELNE